MFKLLRYFSIVSFVVLVLTTIVLITLSRHVAVHQLTELTGQQNTSLARSFANALNRTEIVGEDIERLMAGLTIVAIKIYDRGGLTIFSSDAGQIGEDQSRNPDFLTASRVAQPVNRLIRQDTFADASSELVRHDLVETYVPLLSTDNNTVVAVYHLYSDVTQRMIEIEYSQTRLTKVVLLSFVILYVSLFLVVQRGDRILHRQYQNLLHNEQAIRRTHRQLEQEVNQRTQIEQALQQAQQSLESDKTAEYEPQEEAQNDYAAAIKPFRSSAYI